MQGNSSWPFGQITIPGRGDEGTQSLANSPGGSLSGGSGRAVSSRWKMAQIGCHSRTRWRSQFFSVWVAVLRNECFCVARASSAAITCLSPRPNEAEGPSGSPIDPLSCPRLASTGTSFDFAHPENQPRSLATLERLSGAGWNRRRCFCSARP